MIRELLDMNQNATKCSQQMCSAYKSEDGAPFHDEESFPVFAVQKCQLKKWFVVFSDEQKQRILRDLIENCPTTHLKPVQGVFDELHGTARCDFTTVLPHYLLIYLFTFCDSRSLSTLSQVSWYCKLIADSNDVWRMKCKQRGWRLQNVDHQVYLPLGFWKRFYLEKQRIVSHATQVKARHERLLNEYSTRSYGKAKRNKSTFGAPRTRLQEHTAHPETPTSPTRIFPLFGWKTTAQIERDSLKGRPFRFRTLETNNIQQYCRSCSPQYNANSAFKHQNRRAVLPFSHLNDVISQRPSSNDQNCPTVSVKTSNATKSLTPWLPSSKTWKGRTQSLESPDQIASRWKAVRRAYSVKTLFNRSSTDCTTKHNAGSKIKGIISKEDLCCSEETRYAEVFGVPCTKDTRAESQCSPWDLLLKTEDRQVSRCELHSWSRNDCNIHGGAPSESEVSMAGDSEINKLDHSDVTYSLHTKNSQHFTHHNYSDKSTSIVVASREVALSPIAFSPIALPLKIPVSDAQAQCGSVAVHNSCDRMTSISAQYHNSLFSHPSDQADGPWPRMKNAPEVFWQSLCHKATSAGLEYKDIGLSPLKSTCYNMEPALKDDSQATVVTSCTDIASTITASTNEYDCDPPMFSAPSDYQPHSQPDTDTNLRHPCTVGTNHTYSPALLPSEFTTTCDLQEIQNFGNGQRMMQEAVVIQKVVRGC